MLQEKRAAQRRREKNWADNLRLVVGEQEWSRRQREKKRRLREGQRLSGFSQRGSSLALGSVPVYPWAVRKLTEAGRRARDKGIEFSITTENIFCPMVCPVLGIPLVYGAKDGKVAPNLASLDRIDNRRGYVPGNVHVISWRANALKSDGTLAELEAVVRYLREGLWIVYATVNLV